MEKKYRAIIITGVLMVMIGVFAATYMLSGDQTTEMPDLMGVKAIKAEDIFESRGFSGSVLRYELADGMTVSRKEIRKGDYYIIATDPEAGRTISFSEDILIIIRPE